MQSSPNYICPICSNLLVLSGDDKPQAFVCEKNHSFDVAKEGYVNLLPVQMKKSLQPGDDKNMVLARRAFLETGHYSFLQQALINKIEDHIAKLPIKEKSIGEEPLSSQIKLVDLGCGEGYYTNEIEHSITSAQLIVYGVDISKPAVKYAAKRNKNVHYSVSTNAQLPFADNHLDIIANVFAPMIGKECARVLKSTGKIFSVAPGPKHLFELKSFIYDEPELHTEPKVPDCFILTANSNIEHEIEIKTASELSNLLTMTPFGWKTSEQARTEMLNALPLRVSLEFVISEFRPNVDQAD